MIRNALPLLLAPLLLSAPIDHRPFELPAHFEPYDNGLLARTNRGAYFLTSAGALRFAGSQVEMRFTAANPAPAEPFDLLPGKSNYLRGEDRTKWRTGVPQFGGARFRQIYPGVDLIYHADSKLEYDLLIAPRTSTRRIAMQFAGADSVKLGRDGSLIVRANRHDLRLDRPRISQDGKPVRGGYRLLNANRAGFWIGDYDKNRPLLIDPVVGTFATFGSFGVNVLGIATDAAGNAYIAGTVNPGYPLPVVNALQPAPGTGNCSPESFEGVAQPCLDVFVAKLDPTGTKILYSTFLGDNGYDTYGGLAVDAQGNAYLSGTAFPASGYVPTPAPSAGQGFVRKLSPDGSTLVYNQSLGASTQAAGIAVDASGNAYVTGTSYSSSFPAVHAIQSQTVTKSMFVSKDGGVTWNPVPIPAMKVNMLAIPPGQSSTLYAATASGLFKSLDSGATWTNLIPSATSVTAVVLDPKTPSTVYAVYPAPANPVGSSILARSLDGGSTWSNIGGTIPLELIYAQPPPIEALAIDPENSSALWIAAGVNEATIDKSTDGGQTWQVVFGKVPVPPPFPFTPSELLIDPTNSSHVYACCANRAGGGVYFTTDGGNTWVEGSAGEVGAPVLDPANPLVLYATGNGLERSPDGGQTWAAVPTPQVPQNLNNVLIESSTIYIISDAGYLLRSPDKGVTWTITTGPWVVGSTLLAIDPVQPNTVYVSSPQTQVEDAFVTKLDTAGNIVWATLLGGSNNDSGTAIAVDAKGDAYITGTTNSVDLPVVNAVQPALDTTFGNQPDAFVSEISGDGSTLVYSTYLGGRYADNGLVIAVDSGGNTYVAGLTASPDFPAVNPLWSASGAGFFTKLSAGGQKIVTSTLLPAVPAALAIDATGAAWIAGSGGMSLPLVQPVQESSNGGFVSQLTPSASAFQFSTYLGCGPIAGLALGTGGSVWLAGRACASDFPPIGSSTLGSGGFFARIDPAPPAAQPGIPRIDGVYNGGSFQLGDVVAPGEIVTLIGAELASSTQSTSGAPLATTLSDVSISIGGQPAPLYYVSASQINLQVPTNLSLGVADLAVTRNGNVTHRTVNVIAIRPGIFFVNGVPAITHSSDFSLVTASNPAHPGEYLSVFCSGLGPTNPNVPAGTAAPLAVVPIQTPAVAVVGGRELTLEYAGLVPGSIGLYQVNFQLPSDTSPGLTDLYLFLQPTTGEIMSNDVPLYVQ